MIANMGLTISQFNKALFNDGRPDPGQTVSADNGVAPVATPDKQTRPEANSSTFLQNVIDAYESSIVILDKDQKILFVNRAWREFSSLTGVSADHSCIGSRYPDLSVGAAASRNRDAVAISRGVKRVIEKTEIEFQTEYLCTATAEPLWFRVHAASFFSPDGDSTLILVSHENISDEKQAAKLWLRDRERMNRLLDSTKILPWEADPVTGAITYIGDRAEHIFGYARQEWLVPEFWINHVHPEDRERTAAEFDRISKELGQHQHAYRFITKDRNVVWINDIVTVQWEHGGPAIVTGYMIDVTERKLSEETMLLLSGRLITAQEDERKRIARELHDDLNQRMALMSIELEQMGQQLTNKTDGLSERIRELQSKAVQVSQEIHRMSYELHPSKLDHLGLVPALKSFCSELSERRRIRINFQHDEVSILSPDITLCLFRVAQEALQNSAKHSGKSAVDVVLRVSETHASLNVSDSGCGFEMKKEKMNEGLGFTSMRERLRLVNGFLTVNSKPFGGTQVMASVPLVDNRSTRREFYP